MKITITATVATLFFFASVQAAAVSDETGSEAADGIYVTILSEGLDFDTDLIIESGDGSGNEAEATDYVTDEVAGGGGEAFTHSESYAASYRVTAYAKDFYQVTGIRCSGAARVDGAIEADVGGGHGHVAIGAKASATVTIGNSEKTAEGLIGAAVAEAQSSLFGTSFQIFGNGVGLTLTYAIIGNEAKKETFADTAATSWIPVDSAIGEYSWTLTTLGEAHKLGQSAFADAYASAEAETEACCGLTFNADLAELNFRSFTEICVYLGDCLGRRVRDWIEYYRVGPLEFSNVESDE